MILWTTDKNGNSVINPNYTQPTFVTRKYKCGYIHYKMEGNREYITVQVDMFAYAIETKSERSAKLLITKWFNKLNS